LLSEFRNPAFDDWQQAWINPVYLVPGSISQPKFRGMKTGLFSRKRKGLVLQIAVPTEVVLGSKINDFIVNSVRDAATFSETYFASKGLPFSIEQAEHIIVRVEKRLREF
jgi:hypothetical protein